MALADSSESDVIGYAFLGMSPCSPYKPLTEALEWQQKAKVFIEAEQKREEMTIQ